MPQQQWILWGDPHCGSKTGLTSQPKNKIQEELLKRYADAISWAGQPDVSMLNGDGTDGKDEKGGDIDTPDMLEQAEDCARLIVMQNPKKEVILVTGTRYHDSVTGQQEVIKHIETCVHLEMLRQHKRDIKVSTVRKLKTTINKWFLLEARHFVGGSTIPHGRATAPLKDQVWNVMNAAIASAEANRAAKWPNLLVFSHRHYYSAAETAWGDVMILPAWQGLGGIFGDEICSGHVDLGLVRLTVGDKETDGWRREKRLYSAGVVPRTESR